MSNRLIKEIQHTVTLNFLFHKRILTSALYLKKFKKYNDNKLNEIMLYLLDYSKKDKNIKMENIQNNDIYLIHYRIYKGLKLYFSNIYSTKNICDMKKRNNEALEFGKKLENEGHKCVKYMETYPIQIYWCGNKQCDKK